MASVASLVVSVHYCATRPPPKLYHHDLEVTCGGRLGCTNGLYWVRARISERMGIIIAMSGDSLRIMLPMPMKSLLVVSIISER